MSHLKLSKLYLTKLSESNKGNK